MTEQPRSHSHLPERIVNRAFDDLPLLRAGWTDLPSALWHYADADAALTIIQRQELWATNALFMNDKSVRVGPTAREDLSARAINYRLDQCGFDVRTVRSSIPLRA